MGRELLQDSDGVNESFWDGQGVEIEAKQVFDGRVCVCVCARVCVCVCACARAFERAARTQRNASHSQTPPEETVTETWPRQPLRRWTRRGLQ